jgi:hypothetical protein
VQVSKCISVCINSIQGYFRDEDVFPYYDDIQVNLVYEELSGVTRSFVTLASILYSSYILLNNWSIKGTPLCLLHHDHFCTLFLDGVSVRQLLGKIFPILNPQFTISGGYGYALTLPALSYGLHSKRCFLYVPVVLVIYLVLLRKTSRIDLGAGNRWKRLRRLFANDAIFSASAISSFVSIMIFGILR